jgi:hypothetical protein
MSSIEVVNRTLLIFLFVMMVKCREFTCTLECIQEYSNNPVPFSQQQKQNRQCTHQRRFKRVRVSIVDGKEISITYSGCVSVFLVIQLPKRMRLIILLSVAFAALQYFFTLSHYFLYKFVTFPILRIIQRVIIINVYTSLCKSTRYYRQILNELRLSLQIFERY